FSTRTAISSISCPRIVSVPGPVNPAGSHQSPPEHRSEAGHEEKRGHEPLPVEEEQPEKGKEHEEAEPVEADLPAIGPASLPREHRQLPREVDGRVEEEEHHEEAGEREHPAHRAEKGPGDPCHGRRRGFEKDARDGLRLEEDDEESNREERHDELEPRPLR